MKVFKTLGYVGFFMTWVIIGLYVTFPWDVAKERLFELIHQQSGVTITAKTLRPDWLTGFKATSVKVLTKGSTEPLEFASLEARAKVLTFLQGKRGFTVAMPLARGKVDADVTLSDDEIDLEANIEGVHLELVSGLQSAGFPAAGKLTASADLVYNTKDPKKTEGKITLKTTDLKVEKGTKLGMFSLPRTFELGVLNASLPIKAGKVNVPQLEIKGKDVELNASGDATLFKPLSRSQLNLSVGFKPTPALLSSEPLIGALLRNVQRARGTDGFYRYLVSGTASRPRFRPKT
jgi:type II secretion system protein N